MAKLRDLKDVVCFPTDTPEEREVAIKILDRLIEDYARGD